jgi:hypothetical protein
MGVPTPAPGVGTFSTPHWGQSHPGGVGPLTSVRIRRDERSGANNPRTRSYSPDVQG